jgi:heme-degrading monooxygenase HmoA
VGTTTSPRAETETPASTPIAVANCVSGPRDLANWIIEMFRPFVPTLEQVPGFRRFLLRELVHTGPDCMLISLSFWDDTASFETWRTSERFVAAHATAEADRHRFNQLNHAKRYDFPITDDVAPEDLDGLIIRRLAGDYSGVDTHGACFRDAIGFLPGHRSAAAASAR